MAATFLEPLSVLVSSVLLLHCAARLRRRLPAPLGLACAHLAGTAFLLAAPGNAARAATLPPSSLLDRLAGVASSLGGLFDPTWIVAVALVAFAVAGTIPLGWSVVRGGRGWMFLVLALAYMAILIGVPRSAMSARAAFPASVFLVCYLASVLVRRPDDGRRARALATAVGVVAVLHVGIVGRDLAHLAAIDRAWAADPRLRSGPASDVVLPRVTVGGRTLRASKHIFFAGLTSDPSYFVNRCYAAAMHVRTVAVPP